MEKSSLGFGPIDACKHTVIFAYNSKLTVVFRSSALSINSSKRSPLCAMVSVKKKGKLSKLKKIGMLFQTPKVYNLKLAIVVGVSGEQSRE